MRCDYYITIQILENMKPIGHEWNKDDRGIVDLMENVAIPQDKLARVKYGIGMTINIGDYQSARVDVGIELPVHVDETTVGYDTAVDFCNDRLMEEVANLQLLKKGK